jgi:hypothetical protein
VQVNKLVRENNRAEAMLDRRDNEIKALKAANAQLDQVEKRSDSLEPNHYVSRGELM